MNEASGQNEPVRILIADDHEIVRQGMRSLFSLRGNWEVCGEAVDGIDAVAKAKQLKPDVILLDITMPQLNGLEVARIVRREVPQSKIIVVSQHDPAHMRARALDVGAHGYVAKSDLSRDLLAAIEAVIQRRPSRALTPNGGGNVVSIDALEFSTDLTEDKPPEEEAKRGRGLLAKFVEQAPAAIAMLNRKMAFLQVSDRWLNDFGLRRKAVLGRSYYEVFPDIPEHMKQVHRRCLAGAVERSEECVVREDGSKQWLHWEVRPWGDTQVEGILIFFEDTTERHKAEEARFRLAAVVECSDDAIIAKDLTGTITNWNAGAQRIFGYTEAEAIGQNIVMIIPPELRDEETQILRRLKAGERIDHYETVRLTKAGKRVNVSLTVSPVRDSAGTIIGASKIARDITERRRVEESLRQSDQRLRFSLEAANVGTWHWDIGEDKVLWSDNMENILGLQPGSFGGTFESFLQGVHSEDRENVQKTVQQAIAGDGKYHLEYRQLRGDGSVGWMEATGMVEYDESHKPSRMMGICTDITQRKASQDTLNGIHEELERRVKERTVELERAQQSLRALSGRLLEAQDAERRRIARELHDSAGQILSALKMNLAQVEANLRESDSISVKPVQSSLELIDELSKELRTMSYLLHPPLLDEAGLPSAIRWYVEGFAERSGIQVSLDVDSDLGRLSSELETTIFRIVQEGLTNIHRHSGSSTATIRVARADHTVRVEISDMGKGMPASVEGTSPAVTKLGVGIQGMRERVRQLSGQFEIVSGSRGTSVIAILPEQETAQVQNPNA